MTVGDRIREKRLELGLTQEELAKRMGYKGKTSICVVETGGDNVTTTKVKKFATALGVSPSYLMGWESDNIVENVNESYSAASNTNEDVNKAIKLYELYEKAPSEVQKAVELLLKSSRSDP